jgi:hypothetical protein
MSNTANRSINIYVNSGEAERAYDNLVDRNTKLQKQLERTVQQQKKLVSAIATGDQQAVKENEKLIAKVKELNDTMTTNSQRADTLKKKLSGELSPSMKELASTVARLKKELYSMSQEDAGFKDKIKDYNQAKFALDQYANKLVSVRNKWSDMMKSAKGVAFGMIIGNTLDTAVTSVASYFSGIISGSAKISDELSNIKKVSNLTDTEVKKLNASFGDLQTRTANTDLRSIAVGLGQIGQAVTTENVDAINKIVVALGDEFGGGAGQITNELGVLRNNLQDIKTGAYDQDMLHIGNAINVLGATGLATGEKTVDIANRIGSVASVYGITAGQVLGMAGSFQELGINVERGSTAYVKLLGKMALNTDTFAKVAGMSVQEFTNLVNTDMNSALLKVAEGSKNASANSVEFANILSELETEGAGATELLSKLGSNTALVTDRINVSTKALTESNSVLSEYAEKNNNAAGKLEILKKNINSFKESKALNDVVSTGISLLSSFVSILIKYPVVFKLLAISIGAYTAQLIYSYAASNKLFIIENARILVDKAIVAWTTIKNAVTRAYAVTVDILTGRTTIAIAVQEAYAAVMAMTNPFTLALAAVTALAAGIVVYYNNAKEAITQGKLLADIQLQASQNIVAEKVELEGLLEVAKNELLSKEKRQEAIDKINKISPEYLGNITLENINTQEATTSVNNYIDALLKKAKIQAAQEQLVEVQKKIIDAEGKSIDDYVTGLDKADLWVQKHLASEASYNSAKLLYEKGRKEELEDLNKKAEYLANIRNELNKGNDDLKKFADQMGATMIDGEIYLDPNKASSHSSKTTNTKTISNKVTTTTTTSKSTTTDKTKENLDKTKDELEAFRQKLLEVQLELQGGTMGDNDKLLNDAREKFIQLSKEAEKFKQFFPSLKLEIDKLEGMKLDQVMFGINTKNLESDYAEALDSLGDYYTDVRSARKQDYANGKLSEYEYQQALKQLQTDELTAKLITIENYEKAGVERSHADKLKAEKELQQNITDNAIAEAKERADADTSNANIAVSKAKRLGNIDAIKQAELNQLAIWYTQEQNQYRGNKQKLLEIEEEYQNRLAGITNKSTKKSIDTISLLPEGVRDNYTKVVGEISKIAGGVNTLVGSIGNMLAQQTEQQIAEVNRRTESEDKYLKEQLDNKLISQEAYDQKKAQLDRKAAEELKRLRIKQFEQEKAMKLIQAGMNVALGVTQAIAQTGVGAIVAGVLVAAAGAAEIALIASSQPPSYGDGTILDGPKHSDKSKGLPIINPYTGQVLARVEGGEAVIPDATVQANRPLIDHMLANKGKSIYQKTMARYMQVPNLNSSRISSNVQMANGGYILNASNRFNSNTTENIGKMQSMNDKYLKDISKYTKTQAGKEMSISLTEINRKEKFINGKKAVAI